MAAGWYHPSLTVPMDHKLALTLLAERYSVCRLDPRATTPRWAQANGSFCSITRTATELSIVCSDRLVPSDVTAYRGWRLFAVQGPLDPNLIGVLARLTSTLAAAGVSVFAVSTFDTDYLLVHEADTQRAAEALRSAGHRVTDGT
jgi:hypothetical protein